MKAVLAAVALVALVATGCAGTATVPAGGPSSAGDPVAATGVRPGLVDGEAAHRLVRAGVKVVDVRTPAEFGAGHVPGAVNIPFDEMAVRHGELGPPVTPVLVYCQSGRRSALASATLQEKGFTRIYDLQAYDRWVAAEPPGR